MAKTKVVTNGLRNLPSVDRILGDPRMEALASAYSRDAILGLTRSHLDSLRQEISQGALVPTYDALVESICAKAKSLWRPSPTPVINATGVIIHTNLGRAPLSQEAIDAVLTAARGYSDLEYDLEAGERGSRHAHLESLLCQLIGAEAGLVVNNNASALLLALSSIAKDREVIVSRGEAVEIGGGFRIPEVLTQSGAKLVEVGTTNRTYIKDYEAAIGDATAALLKVHASNFRVVGFSHAASVEELVKLGAERGIPVLHDLGSGCLLDTAQFGLEHEPMPQESIAAGADLAFFSGDKLLGGPQAGIIVGKRELVERLKRHPLARAIRIDKLDLAALSATLLHYLKGEAIAKVPVWRMIAADSGAHKSRAFRWANLIGHECTVREGLSTIGGGSLPGETLPTWVVSISDGTLTAGVEELARRLRKANPPVIGRIDKDRLLLDPRTVLPEEDEPLLKAVSAALAG